MFVNIYNLNRNKRSLLVAMVYGLLLCTALWAAWEVRFDFLVPEGQVKVRLLTLLPFVGLKLALLILLRQFCSMLTFFGLPDMFRVFFALVISSLIGLVWWLICHKEPDMVYVLPRGVLVVDFILAMSFICGFRLALRVYRERITLPKRMGPHKAARRIAILGAGDVGASLASECISRPARGLLPVVFLDDDEDKRGGLVHGIPVGGRIDEVDRLRERFEFEHVIIAMPTAPEKRLREVIKLMTDKGLGVEIVPSVHDLVSGRAKVTRIRAVEVEDLLGRDPVVLDSEGIFKMVADKVVMVTGAGGSIGPSVLRIGSQLKSGAGGGRPGRDERLGHRRPAAHPLVATREVGVAAVVAQRRARCGRGDGARLRRGHHGLAARPRAGMSGAGAPSRSAPEESATRAVGPFPLDERIGTRQRGNRGGPRRARDERLVELERGLGSIDHPLGELVGRRRGDRRGSHRLLDHRHATHDLRGRSLRLAIGQTELDLVVRAEREADLLHPVDPDLVDPVAVAQALHEEGGFVDGVSLLELRASIRRAVDHHERHRVTPLSSLRRGHRGARRRGRHRPSSDRPLVGATGSS